jgi:uncharacterized protein Yka (UPF0111/DUF47 family)
VSDTPRTDAAYSIYDLRKVAQDIERQLNEANKTNRLQYELITTAEKRGVDKSKEELNAANERIKRLEEAGDEMHRYIFDQTNTRWIICAIQWREAKEAKP